MGQKKNSSDNFGFRPLKFITVGYQPKRGNNGYQPTTTTPATPPNRTSSVQPPKQKIKQ